ncbi:hypothetical protein IQ03_02464 [Gemmobacter caeni]|uniref:Uncharacterized protein n=1 Tax=Gemmobacter caeni TaxID=589035 RepID=A0A2T6AZ25_9RHOB|nr:hypothetical protein [Gemmobacter caeni]PTX49061.1 hypothetical protein C8N34_108171 [Gemmobacter caeni]TWI98938.1 hypothetical protein IQ03_02464 [Gemmobacter caeni]
MSVFLPVVPNWRFPVRDTYEFRTEILSSRDGTESRSALREHPRRKIEFTALLDGSRNRDMAMAMAAGRDGRFEIADYTAEPAFITAVAATATTLTLLSDGPPWLDGALSEVAIVSSRTARKVTVAGIAGNTITLDGQIGVAIPDGAAIYPVLDVIQSQSLTVSVYTTRLTSVDMAFDVTPGTSLDDSSDSDILSAGAFYGRYVLLKKPNYMRSPRLNFEMTFERVDFERGIVNTYAPVPFTRRSLSAEYVGFDRPGVRELLDLFLRNKGKLGEIYVPTWGDDFPPVIGITGTTLTVAGRTFYDAYATDEAHTAFLLKKSNGDMVPFEIQSMSLSSGNTVLTLDRTVGLSPVEVSSVSWMHVCRFANDALVIDWETNTIASVVLPFISLKNMPVENLYGSNWILATGYWRDLGQWEDTATWKDFP